MPRPIAARRHDEISRRIRNVGTVSVEELAGHFDVSRETIRRDLKALAKLGRLDVVHGGAARRVAETPLGSRRGENPAGKAAIGRAAAALIEDGMVIVLDSGATTLAIAEALGGKSDLTVATNSLAVAVTLCRVPGTRVHMLGGEIDCTDEAAFGIEVLEALGGFRFDMAFVGAGGISPAGEITDYNRAAAEQRGRMILAAARSYIVADATKFGRLTPIRIPQATVATGLITDGPPPDPIAETLRARGTQIIVASADM